jgi:phosphatidylglycerophosphate synthase
VLDPLVRPLIDPLLDRLGRHVARAGVRPNSVTLAGLALGLASAGLIAIGAFLPALGLLLASRLADGLDGAVARATRRTDFGGYLDIVADFAFYGAVPLGFVALDPAANGLAGAFLIATFYVNGASFLGFAILAEKHGLTTTARGAKNLYFSGGLLEGTETIAFFVALCLLPAAFPALATAFGALCLLTAATRVAHARRRFGAPRD